jgi:hypothetical protein
MQALRRGWLRQQRLHKPELLGRQMPEMRKEHQPGTGFMSTGLRVATPDDFFSPADVMPGSIRWAGWLGAPGLSRVQMSLGRTDEAVTTR